MVNRNGFRGTIRDGIECYLGIQYARSGASGRFSDAVPVGVPRQVDADTMAAVPVFPQLPGRLAAAMGDAIDRNPQSESAFFLNVWTPAGGSQLPVLFFIHGGAWMTGGGAATWYDGHTLSAAGMVVVTINYRLGPIAHLGDAAVGNPAFNDIVSALLWVKENIARFDGDPDAITVAGQSAGGWYAHLLSISESTRGMLSRVAHLSTARNHAWSRSHAAAMSARVRVALGGRALHDAPIADLLRGGRQALALEPDEIDSVPTPYLPTLDGATSAIFDSPDQSAAASHVSAVYVRHTGTETSAFYFNSPRQREVDADTVARLGDNAPLGASDIPLSPYAQLVALTSRVHFEAPARALADAFARSGVPTYLRSFDVQSRLDGFLSGHCLDLPFQFGQLDSWGDAPMLTGIDRDAFRHISDLLIGELAAFVSTASPEVRLQRHRAGDSPTPVQI